MNPKKLKDISPVTLLSSNQLQLLFLNDDRAFSFAHDSENRNGEADITKIYLFTCTSGHPVAIAPNDNESQSTQSLDASNSVQSGVATSKVKLTAGRSVSIGPGITTVGYMCSGNGTTGPTFLVVPDKKEYGKF